MEDEGFQEIPEVEGLLMSVVLEVELAGLLLVLVKLVVLEPEKVLPDSWLNWWQFGSVFLLYFLETVISLHRVEGVKGEVLSLEALGNKVLLGWCWLWLCFRHSIIN